MHDAILSTLADMPLEVSVDVSGRNLTLHIVSAFVAAAIAAGKGRSALGWFLVGLFTPCCIGPIVVMFLPDVSAAELEPEEDDTAVFVVEAATPAEREPLPPAEPPRWYYEEAEEAAGPVSLASLVALMRAGAVDQKTLVWRNGMEDWTPLGDVPDLRKHV